jgi:hypothetical protein
VTDQVFTAAKNEALAMAHSGLGLVEVRRGKFTEAIPDLQPALALDSRKDPTNPYLLGVATKIRATLPTRQRRSPSVPSHPEPCRPPASPQQKKPRSAPNPPDSLRETLQLSDPLWRIPCAFPCSAVPNPTN